MKKQKLNYRFHNPNTAEVTADYILKVFIEANMKKVERAMQEVAEKGLEEDKQERMNITVQRSRQSGVARLTEPPVDSYSA